MLCPHCCTLKDGEEGICKVRINNGGELYAETFGRVSGLAIDPIEKKPLYHFLPGSSVLSFGSVGCNLSCLFCQNAHISQSDQYKIDALSSYEPREIIVRAVESKQGSIAYTYNEPVIFYEFMTETARQAKSRGIWNVMVSNGYINPDPLTELLELIDGFNIDLKAFTEDFYRKITHATLKPVLRSISKIAASDKHLEITFLVIPGLNDNEGVFADMIRWIADHCGEKQVLHLSRYFPNHQMQTKSTTIATIEKLMEIARSRLQYVYPGNTGLALDSNTYCPDCGELLIERSYYSTSLQGLAGSRCQGCNAEIPGVYKT